MLITKAAIVTGVRYVQVTNPTTGEMTKKFVADIVTPEGEGRTVNIRHNNGPLSDEKARELGSLNNIAQACQVRTGQYGWYCVIDNRTTVTFDFGPSIEEQVNEEEVTEPTKKGK